MVGEGAREMNKLVSSWASERDGGRAVPPIYPVRRLLLKIVFTVVEA
jgi:hypothetical protein